MQKGFLYQTIYEDLLNGIRAGVYTPEVRLPSEKELAAQYNVSRITSKKALELLAEEGYIHRMPGRGSFITPTAVERLAGTPPTKGVGENRFIGLVVEDFAENFGSYVISGVERGCKAHGYHMVLKRSGGSQQEEERAIADLLSLGVQGLIIMPVHGDTYNPSILRLSAEKFPLVLVDRQLTGIPASFVGTENVSAAKQLTEQLLATGHKNICFVGPASTSTSAVDQRITGFKQACAEEGIVVPDKDLLTTITSTMPGREKDIEKDGASIAAYLQEHPGTDAFFAVEYNLALIVYKALHDLGKKVPEDYSIVCFDGPENFIGDYLFTHVRQDEERIGQESVELLLNAIKGAPIERRMIPGKILTGRSTQGK